MARRRSNTDASNLLFEILLLTPIWVGPVLAVAAFVALRFVCPALVNPDETTLWTIFAGAGKVAAPFAGGLVVVIWVVAEVQKHNRRALLDEQSDLDSIRDLSWQEFEHLVGEAYRRQGYVAEETGSSGGDGGVDLVLSRGKERILIQCKRWRTRKVGVQPVRELFGVLTSESATRAILVTSGVFTREAKSFAAGKPLDLVDGRELLRMIQSVQKSPSPPKASDSLAMGKKPKTKAQESIAATAAVVAPDCPLCTSPMVLRTARKGPHAGTQFWGCSTYPKCRGTKTHA